uniref:BMERB domain-containing protein n=1 Tax=Monodelphis domestica TaxID=13616 RepID=A0A5F8GFN0_MONDO
MGKKDDPKLMQEWFKLVQEKNALVRYESELMIFARELELEDRQSRLQQELRERMAIEGKKAAEFLAGGLILPLALYLYRVSGFLCRSLKDR